MPYQSEIQRRDIVAIFKAGVAAADPYLAVKNTLSIENGLLKILLDLQELNHLQMSMRIFHHLIYFLMFKIL